MFKSKINKTPTGLSRRTLMKSAAVLPALTVPGLSAAQSVTAEEVKPYGLAISSDFPFAKKTITIEGSEMAYVDEGQGQPVAHIEEACRRCNCQRLQVGIILSFRRSLNWRHDRSPGIVDESG